MLEQKKFDRRKFLKVSMVAAAGTALAACAPAAPKATEAPKSEEVVPTQAPASQGPVSFDFWIQEASIKAADASTKLFKEKEPNITPNFVPTPIADTATKLLAAIAAGSGAPDLAFIQYTDMMNFTLRGGKGLTDITEFFKPKLDKWITWPLDLASVDGKILGYPADVGTTGLFYHRKAMEQAGLKSDPESVAKYFATWESYIETGKLLKEKGLFLLDDASGMFDLLRSVTGKKEQAYFDDQGNPIVNADNFLQAAKVSSQLRQEGLDAKIASWSEEWNTALKDGKIVTLISACWWDIILHIIAPDSAGTWGVVPTPGGAVGNMGGSYYCFPQGSKKVAEAFKYVDFIRGSEEGLVADLKVNKFLQSYKPLYDTEIWKAPDPFYGGQTWLSIFSDNIMNVPKIRLNLNDSVAAEVMGQTVKDIVDNNLDPAPELEKAMSTIKDRIKG